MNDYLGRYENFLLCCPLNHSFGFSSLIEMLIYGVHICFPESFFILDIIKEISRCEDNKINSILASPFIVENPYNYYMVVSYQNPAYRIRYRQAK